MSQGAVSPSFDPSSLTTTLPAFEPLMVESRVVPEHRGISMVALKRPARPSLTAAPRSRHNPIWLCASKSVLNSTYSPVKLYSPKHRLRYPKTCLLSSSKHMFTGSSKYSEPWIQWTPAYNQPSRWAPPWRIQVKSRPLQQIPGYSKPFARAQRGLLSPGFTVSPKSTKFEF